MKSLRTNLKQIILAGGALFIATGVSIDTTKVLSFDLNMISAAVAAEDGHAGQGNAKGTKGGTGAKSGGMTSQGSGVGMQGGSGKGSKSLESSVLKGPGEDSDRPPTAGIKGGKGGGGGKPVGAGTKKGDLFGDMYVLIRDPITGVALTEVVNGVTYPKVQAYTVDPVTGKLVLVPGVWVPRDPATGDLILTTYTTSEVEFGRLSVGRSPTKVLDHSLVEALSKLVAADASPTDNIAIVLDASGRLAIATTTVVDGVTTTTVKAIDSPLENLALYKAIANLTGTDRTITVTETSKDGGLPVTYTWTVPTSINIDLLKASLLAAAGDKTGTITLDTVMYINPIVGVADDLSTFTYDRYTTYKDVTVKVLVPATDASGNVIPDSYVAKVVNVYDVVFNSTNDTTTTGAADFATATNDSLQVLEYVHDNALRF